MKRFLYLLRYIKLLKKNKDSLLQSKINNNPSGIRYDWLYRLYTVLNLPLNDELNIKKYGYYYIDNMVKNHIAKMNDFFLKLGLLEYIRLDTKNIIQIDDYNVKIVLRFKYLNLKNLIIFSIPIILVIGVILILFL